MIKLLLCKKKLLLCKNFNSASGLGRYDFIIKLFNLNNNNQPNIYKLREVFNVKMQGSYISLSQNYTLYAFIICESFFWFKMQHNNKIFKT